jgi:hypothetical protein
MLNHYWFGIFLFRRLIMKKNLRFSFLVTLAEKRALERLAEDNGESQASFLRRMIRRAASAQGLEESKLGSSDSQIGENHE